MNPKKSAIFGDSICRLFIDRLKIQLDKHCANENYKLLNHGIASETSEEALKRLNKVIEDNPHTVIIEFGMNDLRKDISQKEFCKNIEFMIDEIQSKTDARVIPVTINPAIGFEDKVDEYNELIRQIARKKALKIADAAALWKKKVKNNKSALRDDLHPNAKGIDIFVEAIMHIITREHTVLLWQYNSREAKCNYRCPYCYYIGLHNPKDKFFGTIEQWEEAFTESFGKQNLIFYLAFGEPTIGGKFYDIVEMIGRHQNWQMRMTSNVSQDLTKLMESKIAKDGRLYINASYHPLAVDRDDFLEKILNLRENGIEVPIVYVTYPPFLERMEDDIDFFSFQHGFVVHVRRFQGWYKGEEYPYAFTDEKRRLIAKYSDDGMIRYMLNQQHNTGDLTYSGLHFFAIDNVGNVGYDSNLFKPYTKYRCIFGNVFQDNFWPLLSPGPYPGRREGTVDGIANLVDAGYKELRGNNVASFARQGGVYKDDNGKVHYKHLNTDFTDSKIRAKYNFPPRNQKDKKALADHDKSQYKRMRKLIYKRKLRTFARNHPRWKNFAMKILGVKIVQKFK
ncbi:MAG: GDSL-type esterase/lipase family protein [Candidatus Zixiibacteriota bacterium]